MEPRGWIYIITNKAMPDLVKIGYSAKDPKLLAAELSHTDLPYPYLVEYSSLVKKPHEIEQKIHSACLDKDKGKGYFKCSSAYAVQTVKTIIGNSSIPEDQRLDDPQKLESKAEGKVQAHPYREWAKEREEILDRWRRKDRIREEIVAFLNLYSSNPGRITEAIKKKYDIEISHYRLNFKNIDEVVSLIDEAFEDKDRENKKREERARKIKELKEYGG